ncbi:hypothetical protein ES708_32740 [subsurface metagenome]
MGDKKRKRTVVTPDKLDNDALTLVLESQGNAIPLVVANLIRMAAPIIARLAIRYIARKARKHFSEQSVNTASDFAGRTVGRIIENALKEDAGNPRK